VVQPTKTGLTDSLTVEAIVFLDAIANSVEDGPARGSPGRLACQRAVVEQRLEFGLELVSQFRDV